MHFFDSNIVTVCWRFSFFFVFRNWIYTLQRLPTTIHMKRKKKEEQSILSEMVGSAYSFFVWHFNGKIASSIYLGSLHYHHHHRCGGGLKKECVSRIQYHCLLLVFLSNIRVNKLVARVATNHHHSWPSRCFVVTIWHRKSLFAFRLWSTLFFSFSIYRPGIQLDVAAVQSGRIKIMIQMDHLWWSCWTCGVNSVKQ